MTIRLSDSICVKFRYGLRSGSATKNEDVLQEDEEERGVKVLYGLRNGSAMKKEEV